MKLRWWPHTLDSRVASTRLRCLRIIEALRRNGHDAGLYAPNEPRPDVLVLSKRYDGASLNQARALQAHGTRLVFDLCDNHFYCDPPTPLWTRRADLLRKTVAYVDAVTVSTPALADVVRTECPSAPPVHVIGDSVEAPWSPDASRRWRHPLEEWALQRLATRMARVRSAGGVALLWFGNHGSENAEGGLRDLLRLREVLRLLSLRQKVTLTVISNHRGKFRSLAQGLPLTCNYLTWSARTFSRAAALHDIALLPISPNQFTLCKTGNRVATALVHGLAVAADVIPSYREFADSILLGDWDAGFQALTADATLRHRMVEAGRRHVAARWGIETISAQWLAIMSDVARTPPRAMKANEESWRTGSNEDSEPT